MPQVLKYKKPRKLNVVSVTLALVLGLAAYLTYQYLPLYLKKQETYRVLEETGSTFAGRKSRYLASSDRMESLRRKMEAQLRQIGVSDPQLETWIEVDEPEVIFGAIYSEWIEWPFDVIAKQEKVYQVEHRVVLK